MSQSRKTAIVVGTLFIVGDIAGVLSVVITCGLLDGHESLMKIAANQDRLVAGTLCILAMGFALALVPVVMYPVFRRFNQVLAMGYVVFRGALETVTYLATATTWLLLLALSQDYLKAGSPAAPQFGTLGGLLLKAQGSIATEMTAIVFCLGALMFAYLFYQSRLIPRWLSIWGLAGAGLYLVVPILSLFGYSAGILMAPLAVQEVVLAVWLIARGFDSRALQASPASASISIAGASAS